jgi:hypothetical protein
LGSGGLLPDGTIKYCLTRREDQKIAAFGSSYTDDAFRL